MTEDRLKVVFEEVGDVAPNGLWVSLDAQCRAAAIWNADIHERRPGESKSCDERVLGTTTKLHRAAAESYSGLVLTSLIKSKAFDELKAKIEEDTEARQNLRKLSDEAED